MGHFLSKGLPRSSSHWILPSSHWPKLDLTLGLLLVAVLSGEREEDFKLGTLALRTTSEEPGW